MNGSQHPELSEAQRALLASVLEHEAEYGGERVLRGFRYGFVFSGCISAIAGGALSIMLGAEAPAAPATAASFSPPVVTSLSSSQAPVSTPAVSIASLSTRPASVSKKVDCGDVPLPPVRFDHFPTIKVYVRHIPYGLVDRECRFHGVYGPTASVGNGSGVAALLSQVTDGGFETKACSWKFANLGFVILPNEDDGVSRQWEVCALRHEIGHINGWPATHPEAHYDADGPIDGLAGLL